MGKHMTDSPHWPIFVAQVYTALASKLLPLASSGAALTLLLLIREGPKHTPNGLAEAEMEAVEQVLCCNLRRSDVVLRGGPECAAVVLIGADAGGVCGVLRRLHQALRACASLAGAFSLGLVALSGAESEVAGLVALALERRCPFLPVLDEGLLAGVGAESVPAAKEQQSVSLDMPTLAGAAKPGRARKVPKPTPEAEPERAEVAQARARALELGVPYLAPPHSIPSSVRKLVPPEVMRQYRCLPVGRDRNALTVALADPTDSGALSYLEQMTGLTIFPVMTDPDVLADLARGQRARRASPEAAPS